MELTDIHASGSPTGLEDFCSTLEQLSEIVGTITALEDAKAEAASKKQHFLKEGYLKQEQALVLKLRGLEQTRVKQADALGWKGLTFRQILNRTSEQQKELLSPLFHNLSLQTKQLAGSKESADRILSLRLKEFEKALEGNLPPHFHETYV